MNEADGLMVAWLLFAMLFVLAAFAIVVTYTVFAFISLYYVYKSCNPDTAVVFLVLSIVIPATMPFFLLADRNLDRGMPPQAAGAPASAGDCAECGANRERTCGSLAGGA